MAVALKALKAVNFRNHRRLCLEKLSHRAVLISGANGSGKTSVLEAVSAFSPGRGLRGELPAKAVGKDSTVGGWWVEAEFDPPLSLAVSWDQTARRRSLLVNRAKRGQLTSLVKRLPVLWTHPDGDRLPADPPSSRLKFLDRLATIFDPNHSSRLLAVEKRRLERKKLLEGEKKADEHWLVALERSIAEDMIALAASRLDLCEQLNRLAGHLEIPAAEVKVEGFCENLLRDKSALAAEDEFAAAAKASRCRDFSLSPWYAGLQFCGRSVFSTGEQKILTLGLVFTASLLLKERLATLPILLLDELPAHLDSKARQSALAVAAFLKTQIWITTAEPQLIEPGLPAGASHIKL